MSEIDPVKIKKLKKNIGSKRINNRSKRSSKNK